MKKIVSIFLVVMLCLLLVPMQTSASESVEHVEEAKGHTHVYPLENTKHRAEYRTYQNSSSQHQTRTRYSIKCLYCSEEFVWYTSWELENHAPSSIYAAECDGTWQTHHYHCRLCGGNETINRVKCPAGPHTGLCPVLPV